MAAENRPRDYYPPNKYDGLWDGPCRKNAHQAYDSYLFHEMVGNLPQKLYDMRHGEPMIDAKQNDRKREGAECAKEELECPERKRKR